MSDETQLIKQAIYERPDDHLRGIPPLFEYEVKITKIDSTRVRFVKGVRFEYELKSLYDRKKDREKTSNE